MTRLHGAPARLAQAATLAASLAVLGAATGCEHGFFRARGSFSSDGGALETWRAVPQGCSLAPADGLAAGQTSTVATFIWPDPLLRDPDREKDRAMVRNAPLTLEIVRAGKGIAAELTAIRPAQPIRLDASDCATLRLATHPGKPEFPGAKATLSGELRLECEVQGSRLAGDLRFSGCAF